MLVRDAMTRFAECIGPDEALQVAARRMRELGVGCLPVCERDRLVGMLTDRDIVARSTAVGADPRRAVVRDAMTPQVITCAHDDEIHSAAHLMQERAVRRLMVLDAGKRLVGLLSVDDLAVVSRVLAAEVIESTREPERWRGDGRGAPAGGAEAQP